MQSGRWERDGIGASAASAVSPDSSTVTESVKAAAQGPRCAWSMPGTKRSVAGVTAAEAVGLEPAVVAAASLTNGGFFQLSV